MTEQTLVMMTPDELQEMITRAVSRADREVKPDEKLMSRREVADMFRISLPTLRSWNNRGVIKSIKIGGRRYFRKQDIEQLVHEKYKR